MKSKNRQKIRVVIIVIFMSLPYISSVSATESLVGSDNDADLWKFDYGYLEDFFEEYEDSTEDIDEMNEVYERLHEKTDEKAEQTGRPDKIDILAIEFDLDSYEVIIQFADDEPDDYDDYETTIGIIWSEEHIYMFILSDDVAEYYNFNNDTDDELKIDDNAVSFYSDESGFNDEEYVRALVIYYDDITDIDNVVVEFYTNEFNYEQIYAIFFWIVILVIVIVCIVALIYVLRNYRENG